MRAKKSTQYLAAAAAAGGLLSLFGLSRDASAAGLYFSDRGVRPLARGGAFVAGADDVGAIWYNPAGLADAGTSVLADFSYMHFTSDYTRRTLVTDTNGTLRVNEMPTVSGTSPFLPIPTIGASFAFSNPRGLSVAIGVYSPYSAISSYPETVNGAPAPQRYSLVSLDGSALVVLGTYIAYKPIEEVSIGGGVQMMTGTFKSTVVFSASPTDRVIGAPEDSTYDAMSELKVGPIFAPSANLGATVKVHPRVRIGASGQLPFHIRAPAKVIVRLPNAVEFDHAYQDGQDAHVQFDLPAILRVGVEVRPIDALRVELAYVREFWSTHTSIDVAPDNIKMYGITGFPSPFAVAPISIPRNFQDTNSVRLGGEYGFDLGGGKILDARAGVNWEESAIPPAYVSALTIDSTKITTAIGAGLHVGEHWRFDLTAAHVFASDVTVAPDQAAVPRVNPVKGNPTRTEAINGGTYSARADIIGVGMEYRF
jgi:long-chain fatty acid transport protein